MVTYFTVTVLITVICHRQQVTVQVSDSSTVPTVHFALHHMFFEKLKKLLPLTGQNLLTPIFFSWLFVFYYGLKIALSKLNSQSIL